jgi:prevent-host-death family protein
MDDIPHAKGQSIGAYEAKTRFSELIARAERGESFVVTKHGREVARIEPAASFDREKARRAVERIRARLAAGGAPVPKEKAQEEWAKLKADIEHDRDERVDRWLKS